MAGGLRYETGRDMPPGMAEKAAVKIAQKMERIAIAPEDPRNDIEEKVALLPVTKAELSHLINDTISYIWKMEDQERTAPEFGYNSRKDLLRKLRQFEEEHFPELDTCSG